MKHTCVMCIQKFNFSNFFSFLFFLEVQATMRAWLLVIAVLATFQPIVQVASTEDSSSSPITTDNTNTNNNSEENNDKDESNYSEQKVREKPDLETQIALEKNLLTLFGMTSRPKLADRSKAVIPEAMKQLYADITGYEFRETVNLPKPGLYAKSANTVRSFTHEGWFNFTNKIYYN